MSIKEDIRSGNIKGAYLLWGEENFLKDYYKKALISKVLANDFVDFNYLEYTTKQPDNDEIADYIIGHAESGDLVITMGCGDIYKAAKLMKKKYTQMGL